jgi:hypothetical protein
VASLPDRYTSRIKLWIATGIAATKSLVGLDVAYLSTTIALESLIDRLNLVLVLSEWIRSN